MAKQGERSATGSFDYDILNVLTKMQDGISAIKKNTEGQKPYEKARDLLKKGVPEQDKKKIQFKLPKLPKGKSILEGLFGIGKMVLAGAFIVGLLKEKITAMIEAWEPTTTFGKMIKSMLEKIFMPSDDDKKADHLGAVKTVLKSLAFWTTAMAAGGFLVGGLPGMMAGAMIGAGLGVFIGLMKITKSPETINFTNRVRDYLHSAGIGAVMGGIIGSAFGGMTIPGVIAGVLIGMALQNIQNMIRTAALENKEGSVFWNGWVALQLSRLFDALLGGIGIAINSVIGGLNRWGMNIKPLKLEDVAMDEAQDVVRKAEYRLLQTKQVRGDNLIDERKLTVTKEDAELLTKHTPDFNLKDYMYKKGSKKDEEYPTTLEYDKEKGGLLTTRSLKMWQLMDSAIARAHAMELLAKATAQRDINYEQSLKDGDYSYDAEPFTKEERFERSRNFSHYLQDNYGLITDLGFSKMDKEIPSRLKKLQNLRDKTADQLKALKEKITEYAANNSTGLENKKYKKMLAAEKILELKQISVKTGLEGLKKYMKRIEFTIPEKKEISVDIGDEMSSLDGKLNNNLIARISEFDSTTSNKVNGGTAIYADNRVVNNGRSDGNNSGLVFADYSPFTRHTKSNIKNLRNFNNISMV